MVGQMGAAVHTAVATVAGVQVSLERLGLCQLHHVWGGSRMAVGCCAWVSDAGMQA